MRKTIINKSNEIIWREFIYEILRTDKNIISELKYKDEEGKRPFILARLTKFC
jgi:deoxyribodipyrimidine photolyase